MNKPPPGFDRLHPLYAKAGLPPERYDEFTEMISGFSTMMTILIKANEDVAPNYITFAMVTPDEQRYELTVKKCHGKAPCEVIDELEAKVAELEGKLRVTESELAEFEGA